DIYAEVPWLELVPRPDARPEDLVAGFNNMRRDRRRAFKTHAGPDVLPVQIPGVGPDVRYVVVVRNPDEAVASIRPFLEAQSDAWLDRWRRSRGAFEGPAGCGACVSAWCSVLCGSERDMCFDQT